MQAAVLYILVKIGSQNIQFTIPSYYVYYVCTTVVILCMVIDQPETG